MRRHRSGDLQLASSRAASWICVLVLGALACGSGDATLLEDGTTVDTVAENALVQLGSLSLALSNNNGSDEIRLIGTINVREATGAVAATIVAAPDSPAAQSATLQPGLYTVEVLDGYSCTQTGNTPNFTGCTFVTATPSPFEVRGGEQTAVTLEITAHFARGQDVTNLLRTGSAQFSLLPTNAVTVLCGTSPGCAGTQICASLEGAAPQCRTTCSSSADCNGLECISVFAAAPAPAGSSAASGVCANP
jgi:hypothetical protein